MRMFLVFLLGVLVGAAALTVTIFAKGQELVVRETPSASSFDETIARLQKEAEAEGWKVLGVRRLHDSVKKEAQLDIRPVAVVDICHAGHAGRILASDVARPVAVFMPCTIAVYEKSDGKTYVASTNAALLAKVFGGVVGEVMGGPVATAQKQFVEAATK